MASNDPAAVEAVMKAAVRVAPGSEAEIKAMKAHWDDRRSAAARSEALAQEAKLLSASPLQMWKTEVELGGNRTAGSTDTSGLYGSLKMTRPGVFWTQDLSARMDYQRDNGATTVEHIIAAYEPRYHIRPDLYGYSLFQYEHDQTIGLDGRYTAGLGMGLKLVGGPGFTVDLDTGPSFRHADYAGSGQRDRFAARGALNANWKIGPGLTLKEEDSLFLEAGNSTASSTTSLETQLFGPMKARLSYNVEYESDAPGRPRKLDTISRATFVYSR